MFEIDFEDCNITETTFWQYDQKWVEVCIDYNNQQLYYYFKEEVEDYIICEWEELR